MHEGEAVSVSTLELSGFSAIVEYIHEVSGIRLGEQKKYLVEQRLGPVMAARGASSLVALVQRARSDISGDLRQEILDAITTQETSFFRDPRTFTWIAKRYLAGLPANGRRVRIWCAACSTGQEPYSIGMLALEQVPTVRLPQVHLVASDLSRPALEQAEAGAYSADEIRRGLSEERKRRFFREANGVWRASPELRDRVEFRRHNLLRDMSAFGTFDLVVLRHVLIYFDPKTRERVIDRMVERINPGGALVMGATEPRPETKRLERVQEDGVVSFRRA